MTCKTEGCTRQVVTRGLCRPCYDKGRQTGTLAIVGTGKKGGRPKGHVKSSPLGEFLEGPPPSEKELQDMAYKRMAAILKNPDANQQEVIALIKVAASFDVETGNEDLKEQLAEVVKLARGDG